MRQATRRRRRCRPPRRRRPRRARGSSSRPQGSRTMYLTRKALSRRTVLRGMGAAVALPLLEAMVPARTLLARTAAAPRTRLVCIEMVHGSAGSTQHGHGQELLDAGHGRTRLRVHADPRAARAVPRLRDRGDADRPAGRRSLVGRRGRRRPLPLERGVPDRRAPQADRGLGRRGRHVDRSDLRPARSARTRRCRRSSSASRTSTRPARAASTTPASTPAQSAGRRRRRRCR